MGSWSLMDRLRRDHPRPSRQLAMRLRQGQAGFLLMRPDGRSVAPGMRASTRDPPWRCGSARSLRPRPSAAARFPASAAAAPAAAWRPAPGARPHSRGALPDVSSAAFAPEGPPRPLEPEPCPPGESPPSSMQAKSGEEPPDGRLDAVASHAGPEALAWRSRRSPASPVLPKAARKASHPPSRPRRLACRAAACHAAEDTWAPDHLRHPAPALSQAARLRQRGG
mmetsp:Transcript_93965/g.223621  ORF Transcript_93965/g.223621 Transcript_93965/m.223621 type:complete len:224 (-) Transcript_93965:136-807(-)